MFTLKVESTSGEVLRLTQNESVYQIVDIDGLNPPKAVINSSTVAGMDGTRFKSSRLQERNIVITIRINGNVEENRINLYRYFRTKQWCKVYYKNGVRDVFIEGYVDSIDCDLFTQSELMQISIVCQDPYFKNAQEIVNDISKVIYQFEFPFSFGDNGATHDGVTIVSSSLDDAMEFSVFEQDLITQIDNKSETEVGFTIDITFIGYAYGPKIVDIITGDFFEIDGAYNVGDRIVINTIKGKKSVKLYRNGVESNLFTKLTQGSKWFQLRLGANFYRYEARVGEAYMRIVYKHNELFEGV